MAYSQDLRDRVLAAYGRGMKTRQIAQMFQVSRSWARRVKQRWRETGETSARRVGSPGVVKVDRGKLKELVREQPDATLQELRQRLGLACAISTISAALRGTGVTFKKRASAPRSRIVRR
jgi:transposase